MKIKFKAPYIVITVLLCAAVLVSCGTEEEQKPAIFSNVIQMDADYGSGNFYFTNVPSEVEYLVLGIFSDPIVTSGKSITNKNQFIGGSRSLIDEHFTRSGVNASFLYDYDPSLMGGNGDFDPVAPFTFINGAHYWAVWGFNSDYTLISATQEYGGP